MLKSTGILTYSEYPRMLTVQINNDFVEYYRWFIEKRLGRRVSTPMQGAHITVIDPIHYKNAREVLKNLKQFQRINGSTIEFSYNPTIILGGLTKKQFYNFYIMVEQPQLEQWRTRIGKFLSDRSQMHITIANTKNIPNEIGANFIISRKKMIELFN